MAGNTPSSADPVSIMRMVMAHRRVAQSPFSQLQEPGADMLAPPQNPFQQAFKKQAAPLVPQAATQVEDQPKQKAPVEAPKATAPGLVQRQPSFVAPQGPWQGPMPTTPFQDRMGDVTQAIAQGTFDPSGANFTTYGPDMHAEGRTPGARFINAAMSSAGVQPQRMDPEGSHKRFESALEGLPIRAEGWDNMMDNTIPSTNIEDRRGEVTWRNKPADQWSVTDYEDFNNANNMEKNAYLQTLVDSAMGNRENYAPEYQADPGRTNQEAQR